MCAFSEKSDPSTELHSGLEGVLHAALTIKTDLIGTDTEDSRDMIDRLRSRIVSQSPISEAIENSLRFVDAEVIAELAPKLEATIKGAIGMPTKIGCSRVLITLFTRHVDDVRPIADRILDSFEC